MLPAAQPSPPPTRSIWLQRSPAGGQQGPVHPTACLSSSLCTVPAAVPLLHWADAALLQLLSTCSPAQLCTLPVPAPVPRHGHGTAELHPSACSPPCSSGTAQRSTARCGAERTRGQGFHWSLRELEANSAPSATCRSKQLCAATPSPECTSLIKGKGKNETTDRGISVSLQGIPCPRQRGADGSQETELKEGRFYPSARRLGQDQLLHLLPLFPRRSAPLRACPPLPPGARQPHAPATLPYLPPARRGSTLGCRPHPNGSGWRRWHTCSRPANSLRHTHHCPTATPASARNPAGVWPWQEVGRLGSGGDKEGSWLRLQSAARTRNPL